MPAILNVDIAFDLVCPWCLIGKRQLDIALQHFSSRHPDVQVRLNWHAVQLLPHIPDAGLPFLTFYEQRLGNLPAVRARQAQVNANAATVGLTIQFDKILTMPNTARAHALLNYAARTRPAADYALLLDRLFAGFFLNGENIGDRETLSVIAEDWKLPAEGVDAVLAQAPNLTPSSIGASGVPYFLFNGRYAMSGARPAAELLANMEVALRDPLAHAVATV